MSLFFRCKNIGLYFCKIPGKFPSMNLDELSQCIARVSSVHEKIALLDQAPKVRSFLEKPSLLRSFLSGVSPECELALKGVIAIGQMDRLEGKAPLDAEKIRDLLEKLLPVDAFYRELGGIVGYQAKILRLLKDSTESEESKELLFHAPTFIDISESQSATVQEAVSFGIDALEETAELYPLGGAADRLHLVDEKTGMELPAARLPFMGRPLLVSLIRDLQARERLYYERRGRQIQTPIAIMTSHEKNNHAHVLQICEEEKWFGRPKELFRFFTQPLVPQVDAEGNWCLLGPMKPLLKPGGHGAIWKLARDQGIFEWLLKLGKKKALVRQINNPVASLDYGLLALLGLGTQGKMIFGFASCPRLVGSAEGVNVLVEKGNGDLVLTNVEYCDFAKFGLRDLPIKEGEPYSRFSSNTNILFADLEALSSAVERCPFPGLLINLKQGGYTLDTGEVRRELLARLESTMQNIADVFVEKKEPGGPIHTKRTFVTYNLRHKTISTAKKAYVPGNSLQETPENCFYVQLQSARELLEKECGFILPPKREVIEYLKEGPDCLFLYHPALGPLYADIGKKIAGGELSFGSELLAEIGDLEIRGLHLDGSLRILADQSMGHFSEGKLLYSDQRGSCSLKNVRVSNGGVDWKHSEPFWKYRYQRKESLEIILRGHSEFVAEDVHFKGAVRFEVPDGKRVRVSPRGESWIAQTEDL
jgi:hypothetical protein